jgi:blue copper oxidase
MKRNILIIYGTLLSTTIIAQNPLVIPATLSGTNFNLTVQSGTKTFYGTIPTPTYGVNGLWLAPTLIVNKGDSITLNVINNLPVKTTMHWHGLHVAPENDGGPHQSIKPNTTWSPSFKIRNNAGTFWYHPHGAGQTDPQVSKGIAGLLIVKDNVEAALNLPRTYGVDDFPLIVQSKAFDELQQIATATGMDTALFVNGTLNPYLDAPEQVVRFRLLNGSSLRSYNFGLSNGQSFYQIATDGGILDTSIKLSRLRLSPGERAEILINLSGMKGQTVYLKSYSSELPNGIYGADSVGNANNKIHDYDDNFLNGADFNLLKINVVSATSGAITSITKSLASINPFNILSATKNRRIVMDTIRLLSFETPNRAEGPFGMNNKSFNMEVVNEVVHLNTTEIWTLVNKTLVAHPFHIHDIQFNIIEKSGKQPPANERGWKDVVLVMPNDSIKFITKFTTFSNSKVPYMYHCHLLHHEDDGMMGSFLVVDSALGIGDLTFSKSIQIFPNPVYSYITLKLNLDLSDAKWSILNVLGETILEEKFNNMDNTTLDVSGLTKGVYFLKVNTAHKIVTQKFIKQ